MVTREVSTRKYEDKTKTRKTTKTQEHKDTIKNWAGLRAFFALFIRGEGRGREKEYKGS